MRIGSTHIFFTERERAMNQTKKSSPSRPGRFILLAGIVGASWLTASTAPAVAQVHEPLVIRVSDAAGHPGGEVAVVLRTYGSRGVGQGQIGVRGRLPGGLFQAGTSHRSTATDGNQAVTALGDTSNLPFAELLEVVVFAANGDAIVSATDFDPETQLATALFSAISGSINAIAGPLAVLRFRLADDVVVGQEYSLELQISGSSMVDGNGQPIALELRPGELTIRSPGAPRKVEAEGDRFVPGAEAVFGFGTTEVFPIVSGSVGLRYDPAVGVAPPVVTIDPRYGSTSSSVSFPEAGLLVVTFSALPGDPPFGTVPGALVEAAMISSACIVSGAVSAVTLDMPNTFLFGPEGAIALAVENGELEFDRTGFGFDDFESGDLRFWCGVVP